NRLLQAQQLVDYLRSLTHEPWLYLQIKFDHPIWWRCLITGATHLSVSPVQIPPKFTSILVEITCTTCTPQPSGRTSTS
ncbi:Uncharacterized protein DAT39_021479, partial [Clarias magur]